MKNSVKKGQVTLFIILALIVTSGIVGFFVYKNYFSENNVSNEFQPLYNYYTSCVEQITFEGAGILGSRGGYIETPFFESGSSYMPSSSQLDFLGTPVPYWFYVSGNNMMKEQIPTVSSMEIQLESYLLNNLYRCDFQDFVERGYLIDYSVSSVDVKIAESQIDVNWKAPITFVLENKSASVSTHKISVNSKLGRNYDLAKKIYFLQNEEDFLGNYALDTLFLHAPTIGFEEGCTPLFFNFQEIRQNLSDAFAENLAFVKLKGSYYDSSADDYFVVEGLSSVSEDVSFKYSSSWPTKIEIYGDNYAEPVGLQQGVSALGFCFVQYNLVYDVVLPVLIQIDAGQELFQFPLIVMIERNQLKAERLSGESFGQEEVVCKNRNQDVKISLEDLNGNPVEATLSFSCLGESCYLGDAEVLGSGSVLETKVPQCVNGLIEARAEGYAPGKYLISSNEETSATITMKEIHSIKLNLGNIPGNALVQFTSDDYSSVVLYPSDKTIDLVEGVYEVKVQIFKNSSTVFPSRVEKKCFDLPASGLGSLVGSTETKCFEVEIPSQTIDQILIGGGSSFEYFDDYSLGQASEFLINVPIFAAPTKLEEINENYIKLEDSQLGVQLA